MKKFKTIIMLLLVAIALYAQRTPRVTNDFKEGDLIFQVSQSRQSPFIQLATNSPWSHCGVIVEKEGKLYVLEASNVVKLTPLKAWIDRGKMGRYKRRRVLNKPVKIKYKGRLWILNIELCGLNMGLQDFGVIRFATCVQNLMQCHTETRRGRRIIKTKQWKSRRHRRCIERRSLFANSISNLYTKRLSQKSCQESVGYTSVTLRYLRPLRDSV